MRSRTQILSNGPKVNRRALSTNLAKAAWHHDYSLTRFEDIPTERAEIRKLIRRLNRRHLRMCGLSLKGA